MCCYSECLASFIRVKITLRFSISSVNSIGIIISWKRNERYRVLHSAAKTSNYHFNSDVTFSTNYVRFFSHWIHFKHISIWKLMLTLIFPIAGMIFHIYMFDYWLVKVSLYRKFVNLCGKVDFFPESQKLIWCHIAMNRTNIVHVDYYLWIERNWLKNVDCQMRHVPNQSSELNKYLIRQYLYCGHQSPWDNQTNRNHLMAQIHDPCCGTRYMLTSALLLNSTSPFKMQLKAEIAMQLPTISNHSQCARWP